MPEPTLGDLHFDGNKTLEYACAALAFVGGEATIGQIQDYFKGALDLDPLPVNIRAQIRDTVNKNAAREGFIIDTGKRLSPRDYVWGLSRKGWAYVNQQRMEIGGNATAASSVRGSESGGSTEHRLGSEIGKGMRNEPWSASEIQSVVNAYFQMLDQEQVGLDYVKARFNESVQLTTGRSKASVEFKFRNVSAVLEEFGEPYVRGYLPAKNAQEALRSAVSDEVNRRRSRVMDVGPTADDQVVQERAVRLLTSGDPIVRPTGHLIPDKVDRMSTVYFRDPVVRAWALRQANGKCEACSADAPFIRADGTPYLEVHHVCPMKDGGADTCENVVAICPACHRRLHHGHDAAEFRNLLYEKVARLRR